MGRMTSLAAIIGQVRSKTANNKSQFLAYADELDIGHLTSLYREIRYEAPRRHLSKRKYLFRPRDPNFDKNSNQREKHLAIALYRKFHKLDARLLPSGQRLEILDYEVPLKAGGSDKSEGRVGDIDMLGLIDGERLAVLELKWKGGTPFGATLQALVYAAILERNLEDIISLELEPKGYAIPQLKRPEIIVLAPTNYWREFYRFDNAWLQKLTSKLCEIACALSLNIQFIELEIGPLEMGCGDKWPELDGDVKIKSLFCSKVR